jgi:hypothetical protein
MNMNHFPKVWHFAALLSSFAHLLDRHGDYHEYWLVKKVGISGYCNAQIDYLNMSEIHVFLFYQSTESWGDTVGGKNASIPIRRRPGIALIN